MEETIEDYYNQLIQEISHELNTAEQMSFNNKIEEWNSDCQKEHYSLLDYFENNRDNFLDELEDLLESINKDFSHPSSSNLPEIISKYYD